MQKLCREPEIDLKPLKRTQPCTITAYRCCCRSTGYGRTRRMCCCCCYRNLPGKWRLIRPRRSDSPNIGSLLRRVLYLSFCQRQARDDVHRLQFLKQKLASVRHPHLGHVFSVFAHRAEGSLQFVIVVA